MARRTPPRLSPETEAERRRRLERLAAAMRENLRRRKEQQRARRTSRPAPAEGAQPGGTDHGEASEG